MWEYYVTVHRSAKLRRWFSAVHDDEGTHYRFEAGTRAEALRRAHHIAEQMHFFHGAAPDVAYRWTQKSA